MDSINNFAPPPMREPAISETAVKPPQGAVVSVEAAQPDSLPAEAASSQAPPPEILAETLLGYGYKVTEANKEMLRAMLEAGIPLTNENIGRMNQAMKLTGSSEKAIFMMQNNMRLTQANAAQLEGFVSGQSKISTQINNLLAAIEQLNDPTLAAQLKQILAGKGIRESAEHASKAEASQMATGDGATTKDGLMTQTSAATQIAENATNSPTPAGTQVAPQQTQATQNAATPQGQSSPQALASRQSGTESSSVLESPVSLKTGEGAGKIHNSGVSSNGGFGSDSGIGNGGVTAGNTASAVLGGSHQAQSSQSPYPSPPSNLLFSLADSTPQSIDRYLSNLREILTQLQATLSTRGEAPATARVLQEVRSLEAQIDFSSQIRNQIFVQLPLFHNGQQTQTSLHVYKDAKKSRSGGESSSALVALDTAAMGHFETYIQKHSRGIHCQFRLESDTIVQAVRNNIHQLSDLLRDSGYSLESFTFLPPGEPYTLLDTPKSITSSPTPMDEIPHFDECV